MASIIGLGTNNPIGKSIPEYWENVAKMSLGVIDKEFDINGHKRNHLIGLCDDFRNINILDILSKTLTEAINDANSRCSSFDMEKTVVVIGTALGNINVFDSCINEEVDEVYDSRFNLLIFEEHLKKEFPDLANVQTISSTCSSGLNALGICIDFLHAGRYENAIVIGVDSVSQFILGGMKSLRTLSKDVMKPFDINRCGMNLGEGLGIMVVSNIDHRNAYCRIDSYASASESHHMMVPEPSGDRLFTIISEVENKSTSKGVYLSGNGTIQNDEGLIAALSKVDYEYVACIKPLIGHTLGASAIIEGIACILALQHRKQLPLYGINQCEGGLKFSESFVDSNCKRIVQVSTSLGGNVAAVNYSI